jgi:putative toxin-antitoxin system antitoxin component (TIGR02293 family)
MEAGMAAGRRAGRAEARVASPTGDRVEPRGSDPLAEVWAVLGGRQLLGRGPRSSPELVERLRAGLPFDALTAVMGRYDIPRDVACRILHLSTRNFLRRKRQGRLSPDESDRLYRLARVLAHADRVFEQPGESSDWVRTPNASLGQEPPLSLLDTDVGVQQVDQILGRIEHGIVG